MELAALSLGVYSTMCPFRLYRPIGWPWRLSRPVEGKGGGRGRAVTNSASRRSALMLASASGRELTKLLKGGRLGPNWPLRIMLTSSIRTMAYAADLKLLKPSIGLTRRFIRRLS